MQHGKAKSALLHMVLIQWPSQRHIQILCHIGGKHYEMINAVIPVGMQTTLPPDCLFATGLNSVDIDLMRTLPFEVPGSGTSSNTTHPQTDAYQVNNYRYVRAPGAAG